MQLGHVVDFAGRAIAGIPLVLRSYRKGVHPAALRCGVRAAGRWWSAAAPRAWRWCSGIVVGVMVGIGATTFSPAARPGARRRHHLLAGEHPRTGSIACALAFSTQSGCRFTAQLGAMRISEEIDATEVMAIRSIPYMVTTRLMASVIAIVPLYILCLGSAT